MATPYTVKSGDTLTRLSKKYHGRTMTESQYKAKLIKGNGTELRAGEKIDLPWSTVPKPKPLKRKVKTSSKKASKAKKNTKNVKKKKTVHNKPKSSCKRCIVDYKGFICQVGDIKVSKMKGAYKSNMKKKKTYNALILHRTHTVDLPPIRSNAYAQFYVDKDGSIYQGCSVNRKRSAHIGKQVRSRSSDNTSIKSGAKYHLGIATDINDVDMKKFINNRYSSNNKTTDKDKKSINQCIKNFPKGRKKRMKKIYQCIHNYEKNKEYPLRYPTNADAIGIEVVGKCTNEVKGIWESIPNAQAQSVAILYNCLTKLYKLGRDDIYTHEQIAHKTLHEGTYVWNAIKTLIRKDHQ